MRSAYAIPSEGVLANDPRAALHCGPTDADLLKGDDMRTLMDPLEPARRDRVPGASALAQAILAPGALRTMFQPIVRLDRAGWTLHAFECLTRGPAGTPFASADSLF